MKKSSLLFALLFVLLLTPAAARADYESCIASKCAPGTRGNTSCAHCQTDVNTCCRTQYNADRDLAAWIACATANALRYAECTGSSGTNSVDPGDGDSSALASFLAEPSASLQRDREVAARVLIELSKLVADLDAQIAGTESLAAPDSQ